MKNPREEKAHVERLVRAGFEAEFPGEALTTRSNIKVGLPSSIEVFVTFRGVEFSKVTSASGAMVQRRLAYAQLVDELLAHARGLKKS